MANGPTKTLGLCRISPVSQSRLFFPFDFSGDVSRGIVRIANNFTPISDHHESTSGEKIRFCWRWMRIANNFIPVSDYRESISSGTIQLYRRRFATNRANWIQSWTLSHPLFLRSTSSRLPVRRLAFLNRNRLSLLSSFKNGKGSYIIISRVLTFGGRANWVKSSSTSYESTQPGCIAHV